MQREIKMRLYTKSKEEIKINMADYQRKQGNSFMFACS